MAWNTYECEPRAVLPETLGAVEPKRGGEDAHDEEDGEAYGEPGLVGEVGVLAGTNDVLQIEGHGRGASKPANRAGGGGRGREGRRGGGGGQ